MYRHLSPLFLFKETLSLLPHFLTHLFASKLVETCPHSLFPLLHHLPPLFRLPALHWTMFLSKLPTTSLSPNPMATFKYFYYFISPQYLAVLTVLLKLVSFTLQDTTPVCVPFFPSLTYFSTSLVGSFI